MLCIVCRSFISRGCFRSSTSVRGLSACYCACVCFASVREWQWVNAPWIVLSIKIQCHISSVTIIIIIIIIIIIEFFFLVLMLCFCTFIHTQNRSWDDCWRSRKQVKTHKRLKMKTFVLRQYMPKMCTLFCVVHIFKKAFIFNILCLLIYFHSQSTWRG